MVRLVQTKPASYKLEGANSLKFIFDMPDAESRFKTVSDTLDLLSRPA
jgi:hypothetical protein